MTALLEVAMRSVTPPDDWDLSRCPAAFTDFLLRRHAHTPRDGQSRMRAHLQLHSMRRDEAGRFNNLEMGGIPKHNPDFIRDLERSVREARRGEWGHEYKPHKSPAELISPVAIDAAIAQLGTEHPKLARVLEHFMKPTRFRRWDADGMAGELGIARRTLYLYRDDAARLVWLALPADERIKMFGVV